MEKEWLIVVLVIVSLVIFVCVSCNSQRKAAEDLMPVLLWWAICLLVMSLTALFAPDGPGTGG